MRIGKVELYQRTGIATMIMRYEPIMSTAPAGPVPSSGQNIRILWELTSTSLGWVGPPRRTSRRTQTAQQLPAYLLTRLFCRSASSKPHQAVSTTNSPALLRGKTPSLIMRQDHASLTEVRFGPRTRVIAACSICTQSALDGCSGRTTTANGRAARCATSLTRLT